MTDSSPRLILASTSTYRQSLLARLALPFETVAPSVDESPLAGESPADLAARLARAKAGCVSVAHPGVTVIGSDQVAELQGEPLGKPGTVSRAVEQLRRCSASTVRFLTAVTLVGPDGSLWHHTDTTLVHFRALEESEIQRYVQRESPLDCAGSFKAEGLGISLFQSIDSRDPTGLTGLPLIWVAQRLRALGFSVP
jgi:septum formation protein